MSEPGGESPADVPTAPPLAGVATRSESLGYAGASTLSPNPRGPRVLAVANLFASAVMFIPIARHDSPVTACWEIATRLLRHSAHGEDWAVFMLLTPLAFLVPVSVWSFRLLSLARGGYDRPRRIEMIVAWCLGGVSFGLSFVVLAFIIMVAETRLFLLTKTVPAVLMVAAVGATYRLHRRFRSNYPAPLFAASAAWTISATLTLLTLLAKNPWTLSLVVASTLIGLQLIACGWAFFAWLRDSATGQLSG